MVRFILFDLDETLYPKESGLMQEISRRISLYMEERLGLEPRLIERLRREYYARYGTTMRGLMIHYGIDPEDYLSYVHDIALEDYIAPDRELDAALEGIEADKVIFTNSSTEHASRVLGILGVKHHFKRIIDIRALDYVSKPNPEAYQRALETLRAKGKECLIVDDRVRNLVPAKELGMTTVLVGFDLSGSAELTEASAEGSEGEERVDFVVGKVAEIGEVVEQLRRV